MKKFGSAVIIIFPKNRSLEKKNGWLKTGYWVNNIRKKKYYLNISENKMVMIDDD